MATVVDSSPPFLQNFGYATLLAEDGRPMHKSWGNSIEFNEAADKMGVDVMRWLYCAHKPENNLLFGYNRGDEARRRFLIPLWNVYSFLVNLRPPGRLGASPARLRPGMPEGPTPAQRQPARPLDPGAPQPGGRRASPKRWRTRTPTRATMALEALLDDLTNWYVRRSRRRFWKSEHDADKDAAYATLYHVLVKLSRLLAPFIPFVTEVMYQNLVRSVQPQAYESVHHTAWPQADSAVHGREPARADGAGARQSPAWG